MSTPKSMTPRTDAIVAALKAAMKPYNKYKTTATAMLLIAQYIKIAQLEIDLATLQAEVESLRKDNEKLELWLAEELGIEKSEPNAGDDPTKQFWIGLDQQCYESMRQAINIAMNNKTP